MEKYPKLTIFKHFQPVLVALKLVWKYENPSNFLQMFYYENVFFKERFENALFYLTTYFLKEWKKSQKIIFGHFPPFY